MQSPRRAARFTTALLSLLGPAAPFPDAALVGVAAPGQHLLYEATVAADLTSSPAAPLRVRSPVPVTVQRYARDWRRSHPLAAGDGAVLVTSDCATDATTVVPTVVVRAGSVTVTLGDGGAATDAAATPAFLAPSSYEVAWHYSGQGQYPEGALSEAERALREPPLESNSAQGVGTCAADAECAARIRVRMPVGGSAAVGLCGCYAASDTHPFDECEGRSAANCRGDSSCTNTCAGFAASCKRNRCALEAVLPAVPELAKPACQTRAQCEERSASVGIAAVTTVDRTTKGCFLKNGVAYWGAGGSEEERAEAGDDIPPKQERLWCGTVQTGGDCAVGPAASPLRACAGDRAYCALRRGVCNNRAGIHEGICREVPKMCAKDMKPVCGCNGKTYPNECTARVEGVNVSRMETCDAPTDESQLVPGDNCKVGPAVTSVRACSGGSEGGKAQCRLRIGVCNNVSGEYEGICMKVPEYCNKQLKPVCGCDGRTYPNECQAWSEGVSAAREGACARAAKRVACRTEKECDARRAALDLAAPLGVSDKYPSKGCVLKKGRAYWSPGSRAAVAEEDLPGLQERLWCEDAAGAPLSLQRTDVATAARAAESAAASPRWLVLASLLRYVAPSTAGGAPPPPREGRALDTCSYNVEILLTGCDDDSPVNIEVSAPSVRVIDSRLKNEVTDTYAVHEARVDGGTKYYSKDYKRTATLTFPWDQAVAVASPARGDGFATVPSFECSVIVPGRPFVGANGRGLLAPQCEGRDASWSGGTAVRAPSVGNATSDDDLGGEWTRNALGEHASVASFAAFSIALMSNQAPSDLVEDALNAALDEVRHAKISFDIASKLVGEELGPGPLPPSSIEFRRDMEALAVAVAREGCVDETLSALAAAAECERIDDALESGAARGAKYRGVADEVLLWIKRELSAIAMDEGNHSALAWRTLSWICSVDAEACEAAKRRVLNEGALTSAFQHRFGRDFEGHPELLERMLAAWTRIYTNAHVLDSENAGAACAAGEVEEVSDHDVTDQSLLSLLVEKISRGLHRGQNRIFVA